MIRHRLCVVLKQAELCLCPAAMGSSCTGKDTSELVSRQQLHRLLWLVRLLESSQGKEMYALPEVVGLDVGREEH